MWRRLRRRPPGSSSPEGVLAMAWNLPGPPSWGVWWGTAPQRTPQLGVRPDGPPPPGPHGRRPGALGWRARPHHGQPGGIPLLSTGASDAGPARAGFGDLRAEDEQQDLTPAEFNAAEAAATALHALAGSIRRRPRDYSSDRREQRSVAGAPVFYFYSISRRSSPDQGTDEHVQQRVPFAAGNGRDLVTCSQVYGPRRVTSAPPRGPSPGDVTRWTARSSQSRVDEALASQWMSRLCRTEITGSWSTTRSWSPTVPSGRSRRPSAR